MGAFNAEVTSFPWTTPTPYPHVSPILLAFSFGGTSEAALDDMPLFPLKSRDAEDSVILGCTSRLFGLSPLVLGNYSPRHGLWVLMESGPGHKFFGPTIYIIEDLKLPFIIMWLFNRSLFSFIFFTTFSKWKFFKGKDLTSLCYLNLNQVIIKIKIKIKSLTKTPIIVSPFFFFFWILVHDID